MKQVYLFEPVYDQKRVSSEIIVKSSREKAISHCNREFNKPNFSIGTQCITVFVAGSTVGWITKKMVQ